MVHYSAGRAPNNNLPSMASETQKGVKDFEKEITCPICQDQCIEALAQSAGANQPFPCPECRRDTLLSQNDPNQLPTAFFVNRMKELHTNMEKAQGKIEAYCDLCSEGKAIAFCRQCAGFICNECIRSHQRMRIFAGHKATTLEDLRKGGARDIPVIGEPSRPTCKVHEKKLKLYCFDCCSLICRDCIIFDHKDHKCEFVKKAAPEMKDKLARNLVQLKEIQASLQQVTDIIEYTKSDIETQTTSITAKINQSFDEFHDLIEQHKQNLLEKASSVAKGKVDELHVQEKDFTIALNTIQSLVDFVEQNIENATEEELMSIHVQMLNRIDEEARKHQQVCVDLEPVQKPGVMLKVGGMEKLRRLCEEEICLFECSVGKIKDAEIGLPMRVAITYKSNSRADIAANLISSLKGLIVQAKIVQKQRNMYEIECTPSVRGRHKLEITVNDLPLPGSPYPVIAKIPPHQFCKPQKVIDSLMDPIDVAINSVGEVIVAEQVGRITVIHKSGRKMHTLIDPQVLLDSLKLEGIAVDHEDNIYVTDNRGGSLFKFNKYCQKIKEIGRDCANLEDFDPWGVTVFQEQVLVTQSTKPLLSFTRDLELVKKIGFNGNALGITHDPDGKIYLCNVSDSCIQVLNSHGEVLYSFGDKDSDKLNNPRSVCVDGEHVYVSEWDDNHCVSVFNKAGKFLTSFGHLRNTEHQFAYPSGLAFNDDNVFYICDRCNRRLMLF